MKRIVAIFYGVIALALVLSVVLPMAFATNPTCTITGNVEGADGNPAPAGTKVCFASSTLQSTGGSIIGPIRPFCKQLDASGNLPAATTLPQGAFINVSVGIAPPTQVQVPTQSTADLWTIIAANTDPNALVSQISSGSSACTVTNPPLGSIGTATITCNAGGSFPLTQNQSGAGFGFTDLGATEFNETTAPTGATAFDWLWGDSTDHRLKMLNNNGTATDVAGASDTVNFFALPTANFSMNSHKITSLALATAANDALSGGVANTVTGTGIADLQAGTPTGGAKTHAINSQSGYYNNGNSAVELAPLNFDGALGALASTAGATLLQVCDTVKNSGTFTNLTCTTDLNGSTCTTAPTFNVRDNTAGTTGTALTCLNAAAGQTTQAQTLAFAAGDQICIVRTVNGGTCTTPVFAVTAHIQEP